MTAMTRVSYHVDWILDMMMKGFEKPAEKKSGKKKRNKEGW